MRVGKPLQSLSVDGYFCEKKREYQPKACFHAIENRIYKANPNAEIPEDILDAIQVLYLYNFIPIYLIFDQFEEIFIFGSEAEQLEFFDFLHRILKSQLPVKILLSMREEYLAYLSSFEKQVPQLV